MRRSEMVELMANEWLGFFSEDDFDGFNKEEFQEEMCEKMSRLLAFLEYKGMKPPVEITDPILYNKEHVWEKE